MNSAENYTALTIYEPPTSSSQSETPPPIIIDESYLWFDGKRIDELAFCNEIMTEQNLRYVDGSFYNLDGVLSTSTVKKIITDKLTAAGVSHGIASKIDNLTNALTHICYCEEFRQPENEIHLQNGILKTDGTFIPEKHFCKNRLNASYLYDTSDPKCWLSFLNDLLEPADILTLQEYMGYCLINSTKAQAMLFLVGKGGEGKSRIGVVMNKLFGNACYNESLVALSGDKFLRGNLVGKTVLVDDDMSFEGIRDTSFLKSLVTAETYVSVQWKNRQAIQAALTVRAVVFSNSPPTSLYDKTEGWHRRLIVLSTKDAPKDRIPDRNLSEKLLAEIDGIFIWAYAGLLRLIENSYCFTLSEKTLVMMNSIKKESCNIIDFLADAQAVQFVSGNVTTSVDIYNAYCNWCYGNGYSPFKQKGFYDWISQNAEKYNISPTNKAWGGRNYVRGYDGIRVSFRSRIE